MKNKEILILEQELPNLNPPDMDRWFNYAVQETIQRATEKAVSIREVIKPKEDMVEYQDELRKLQMKHVNKDEEGNPITEITLIGDGKRMERFDIPDVSNPKGKFNVAADKLKKKFQSAIDGYNEGLKFLDEENEGFQPHWVGVQQVPDGLSRNEMSVVFLMIQKETEKSE